MRKPLAILAGTLVVALGTAGVAIADEAIGPGTYGLTIPGVGELSIEVGDGGEVTAVAVPEGFTVIAEDDDPNEFDVVSTVLAFPLAIEVEVGEDDLEVEGILEAGIHGVTIPDVGTIQVETFADGSPPQVLSVPDGYTLIPDDDNPFEFRLVSDTDPTQAFDIEIDEDGEFEIQVDTEDEVEADDELEDEDSDDDDDSEEDDDGEEDEENVEQDDDDQSEEGDDD